MGVHRIARFKYWAQQIWRRIQARVLEWTEPMRNTSSAGLLHDMACNKTELILENAALRQ